MAPSPPAPPPSPQFQRHALAVIAALLLVAGLFFQYAGLSLGQAESLAGALIRVGVVLGAVWLALPELRRGGNVWVLLAVVFGSLIVAWRPRYFLFALAIAVVAYFLRPRGPRQGGRARRPPAA